MHQYHSDRVNTFLVLEHLEISLHLLQVNGYHLDVLVLVRSHNKVLAVLKGFQWPYPLSDFHDLFIDWVWPLLR